MKSSRFVHLLCLFAYLWASTGVAETLLVHTTIAEHAGTAIVFEPTADNEVLIHHVGHRDAHEPDAIDHEDEGYQSLTAHSEKHSDHVLKLHGADQSVALAAADFKLSKIPAHAIVSVLPTLHYSALTPILLNAAQPPPTRNSRIAFVQLSQLRI